MRSSKLLPRSDRSHLTRRTWQSCLLANKLRVFWGFALLWVLYLSASAIKGPMSGNSRHRRSLLEASAIMGRLEALDFRQHSVDALREAVQKAISPEFGMWRIRGIEDEGLGEYDLLLKSVESLISQLLTAEERVPCGWDAGLEVDFRQLEGRKYLLAANFKNNEQLLPHAIVQIWHLLAILPRGSTYVSIYESGSTDSTGAWLEVLRHLVTVMQVPHRIVVGGSLTRGAEQGRIDFLAQVRNAALEPLWLASDDGSASVRTGVEPPNVKGPWLADRIIFMNDVFFCAKDAIRLLLHDADMACGMDFDRRKLDQVPQEVQRRSLGKYLRHIIGLPAFIGELVGMADSMLELQRRSRAANELFQKDLPMGFYDLWVGRDANGALFLKDAPYATDPYSLQRLPWGLPFPVKCCWNGLVALNAAPFTRHGIRMRSHKAYECAASECTLLCNDFLRLGYQNLVVDPGVRQAYNSRDAKDLYRDEGVKGIKVTQWADVTNAPPVDMGLVPFRPFSQCCGLQQPTDDTVILEAVCTWENFMHPNFTALPDKPQATLEREQASHMAASFKPGLRRLYGKQRPHNLSMSISIQR